MTDITMVVTSCNRKDLLEKTLKSFEEYSPNTISEIIISEDGPEDNSFVNELIKTIPKITLINQTNRVGQLENIYQAYQAVSTPYIFHCEEDWLFTSPNFINNSLTILENFKNCGMVHLRSHTELAKQICEEFVTPIEYKIDSVKYWKVHDHLKWGYSYNPGLRRLEDYQNYDYYKNVLRPNHGVLSNFPGWEIEIHNTATCKNHGMWFACLGPDGSVTHIGGDRHVD
jgi:GT2 family glycosyltransferase